MTKIPLSDVFNGDYLRIITNYSRTIQSVINSYDVVIFMARKAICFYQSMVFNNIITPSECEVLSSRVLDYNIISKLQNRKIAIVDDVVVKGRSLEKVLSELNHNNICSDVFVAACEEHVAEKINANGLHNFSPKFVYLDSSEIFLFSGLITEYIELSMCPFNVDQPIYVCNDNISDTVLKINELSPINITSGIQNKYQITSKVLYLKYEYFINDEINAIIQDSILKIRFIYKEDRIIAIPFVLLPQITKKELNKLYDYFATKNTDLLIDCTNDNIVYENKLKLINSFFSDLLFKDFALSYLFKRCYNIDFYQFYYNTNQLYGDKLSIAAASRQLISETFDYSRFIFPEYVGKGISAISKIEVPSSLYYNAYSQKIDDIVITYEFLFDYFKNNENVDYQIVSSIIDVLIDRGMIVPTIVHFGDKILRAYKLGEYSKLTRTQIEAFATMLYNYQNLIDSNLGKIEFEKLCVLFFTQGIFLRYFEQQTTFEEDCYSVCYSLYGPRMSDSDRAYKVDSDSALITDFLTNDLVKKQNNTYYINPIHIDESKNAYLDSYAKIFALQYSKLKKLFDSVKEQEEKDKKEGDNKTSWNQYVHTYNQYLTLRSIGNSKKNQFLSLCAELYQIMLLDDSFFELNENDKKRYNRIISGINSGLWKYFCYKNDAFNKTNLNIFEKDANVAAIMGSATIPVREDRNPALDRILDKAGETLFSFAFFVQNVISKMNKTGYFCNSYSFESDLDVEKLTTSKMLFSQYYYKEFTEKRHQIEAEINSMNFTDEDIVERLTIMLQEFRRKSQFILDYCELFLESETSQYDNLQKFIVLYSEQDNIPQKIGNINEVIFDEVSIGSKCKVFKLPDREVGAFILNEILDNTININRLYYLVFDMSNAEDGAVHICEHARGTFISKLIKNEINRLRQEPVSDSPKMIFIKNSAVENFARTNYKFVQVTHEKISNKYTRTTLDIIHNKSE